MQTNPIINQIFAIFGATGDATYIGEPVSLSEHMLQTAYAAEQDWAGAALIAAALLHDFGHLIHDLPEDAAEHGIDTVHEQAGAEFLEPYFLSSVTEPTRLHVAAKRYLCAIDSVYLASLSPASILSLELQGGPFNEAEVRAFEALPYAQDAVQLRRYDDSAKEAGAWTPGLEHFQPYLEQALRA
ncbi:MAG: HD domain-containing protein [Herpetosiphonaceae bacterium]|nr:HD domain-containing protein [Herpetosiphonaceae bacterium]